MCLCNLVQSTKASSKHLQIVCLKDFLCAKDFGNCSDNKTKQRRIVFGLNSIFNPILFELGIAAHVQLIYLVSILLNNIAFL
jgi:hypothetical protein